MDEKAISLEMIILAAKEIAQENQVNAAYLMGYAQGLMDAEKQANRNRPEGGEGEQEQTPCGFVTRQAPARQDGWSMRKP